MINLFRRKKYYTFESAADIKTFIDTARVKWKCNPVEDWVTNNIEECKSITTTTDNIEVIIYRHGESAICGVVIYKNPPRDGKLEQVKRLTFRNAEFITEKADTIIDKETSDLLNFIIEQTHIHC